MKRILPVSYAIMYLLCVLLPATATAEASGDGDKSFQLFTRAREKTDDGQFKPVYKTVNLDPRKTAIIVCDMWDTIC
ncbi:MAG: hypothetical protein JXM70_05730, partial [Pirellulales bacterium]|nr:hypothetical protein [Pirellulales bacterium]